MADQNIDMAELEIVFSDTRLMMDEFRRTGSLNVDQFIQLQKQNSKLSQTVAVAEAKLKLFSESMAGKATKAVGDLAKGFGNSALAARQNREAFSSLNPLIDAAGAALSAIPIVGDALNKTLVTVGKFVTEELDQSVKAFQNLGSVGAIGAEGVTGLRNSAIQAGLSFNQLASVVSKNSGDLAFAFGGTASGLKEIAKITQAAEPFRGQLLALGLGFEQQSEAFANYADRSARLGMLERRNTMNLAESSAAYAKNLTKLSSITGASVDSAQAEMDSQMSNIRFRKALSGIDEEVGQAVSNVGVVIAQIGKDPELTRGFQDLVAGFGTEAATNFTIATGGVGKEVADLLKAGAITEQEAMQRLQGAFQQTYEKLPAQVLGVGTAFDNTALGMANLATAQIDYGKALEENKKAAQAKDPATDQMVNAQLSLQKFAVEADTFVQNNVFPNATAVIAKLTDGLAGLAGEINNLTGSGGPSTTSSGGGFWQGIKNMFTGGGGSSPVPIEELDFAAADGAYVRKGQVGLVGEEGPEIFAPGENGRVIPPDQLASLFDQGKKGVLPPDQLSSLFDQIGGMKTAGGSSLVEGLKQTFLPGIGFLDEYAAGGLSQKQLSGNMLGSQSRYQTNDMSFQETVSGPKNNYASNVLGTNALSSLTSTQPGADGNSDTSVSKSGAMTSEMIDSLIAELKVIAQHTKEGADAGKKLIRAQS